ncbi:hypothetical protein CHAN_01880 [Corynebacterium hansenii]|nr:hypothetical protein CHAN_01880 [Corynebacterium hansenii]
MIAVGLVMIGSMLFFAIALGGFGFGDWGMTLRKLERQASAEMPGVDVHFREHIARWRDINMQASADVGSVDEVMRIHRGAVALGETAGDALWGFGSEITVRMARPEGELVVEFSERTDPGELRGILEDERSLVFDRIRLGRSSLPVLLVGRSCGRADIRCFTDHATAAAGIEEAGYRTPISREVTGRGQISIEIPVHDAAMSKNEARTRERNPVRSFERGSTTILVEIVGPKDRAAAADVIRWSVPAVGRMAAIGFDDDDGHHEQLRVRPRVGDSPRGTSIELDAENVGEVWRGADPSIDPGVAKRREERNEPAVARAIDRVEAMLRELAAAGPDAPSADKGIPVTIDGIRKTGSMRVVVGGCSEEPADSDEEARLRDEFEVCR